MHARIAQQSPRYPEENGNPSGTWHEKWMAGSGKNKTCTVVWTKGPV
ncbi:hypothetical protein LptCag_0778 [Leptospirillum ferriphilum]|uniref:Uncharacterized protein n=1 Tax=Leptospirillum ferriphilum TaxID=178606 RepID=A0A094WET2_9BACT|nr:hypothetical protein LptCag_0778 [Leptospirillum ferriphilum]